MSEPSQHPTPPSASSPDSPPPAVGATPSGLPLMDVANSFPTKRRSVKTEPLTTTATTAIETTAEVYSVVDEDISYGPANRINTLKVAYYSRQYERELVFAFHRNSAELPDAGEYRCVQCQRLDPNWECLVYVSNDEFIGLDPDYGVRGHCCVMDAPPTTTPRNVQKNVDFFEEPTFGDANSQQAPTPKTTSRKASTENPAYVHKSTRPINKRFGPAQFLDAAKNRVTYHSKLYPGAVLVFSLTGLKNGDEKRTNYRCEKCFNLNRKGKLGQKIAGVSVLQGEFVDHDPDLAGTAPHGHLCMKPDTVAELEAQLPGFPSSAKQAKNSCTGGVLQHFEYSKSGQEECESPATPKHAGQPMSTDVRGAVDAGQKSEFSTPTVQRATQKGHNGSIGSCRRGKPLGEVNERFGPAQFVDDTKRELCYESRRYPGDNLRFLLQGQYTDQRRNSYRCVDCSRISSRFRVVGVKPVTVNVLFDEIVDRDPDEAGTNLGHLCQQPEKIAELETKMPAGASGKRKSLVGFSGAKDEVLAQRNGSRQTLTAPSDRKSGAPKMRRSGQEEEERRFGQAHFTNDEKREFYYESKRYPGVHLRFWFHARSGNGESPRSYFRCDKCYTLYGRLRVVGVKYVTAMVHHGEIVSRDPDEAGTNFGHLCQQPQKVAELEGQLSLVRKRKSLAGMNSSSGQPHGSGQTTLSIVPTARRSTSVRITAHSEPQPHHGDNKPAIAPMLQEADVEILEQKPSRDAVKVPMRHVATASSVAPQDAAPAVATHAASNEHTAVATPLAAAPSSGLGYSSKFGKAIRSDDPTVVFYEGVYGVTYKFKLVTEKAIKNNDGTRQMIRTYRCVACQEATDKKSLKDDIPLVRTIDDVFVGRDPDQPLDNEHLCMQ